MEDCDFMNASEATRNFIWHVFCDHYLEAAKTRLYGDGDGKKAAQQTLHYTVERMIKLMAPITPHITEEIWRTMYDPDTSIQLSAWPEYDKAMVDEEAEKAGDIVIAAISDIRREKNRRGVSLNASMNSVKLYASGDDAEALKLGSADIEDTLKIESLEIVAGDGGDAKLEDYPEIGFTVTL